MSSANTSILSLRKNLWILSDKYLDKYFYIFAAKSTPWQNDDNPPNVDNSVNSFDYQINQEILFGKYISLGYSRLMIPRYDWNFGTIYTRFDDKDPNLFDKIFYVVTSEAGSYNVFKCLNNNNGAPSTVQPLLSETAADDVYYSTSDGYQWKYMYTIDAINFNRFATVDYVPVITNTAVSGNAVYGAIETYIIDSAGANYNSYTNGYFTDTVVGGNDKYFGIQGPDSTVLTVSSNNYILGETIRQIYGGIEANGTIFSQSTISTDRKLISLRNVNNIFKRTQDGGGTIIGLTSLNTSDVYDATDPDVSSNNNFYNGCSIYITSGTGAGQIRTISQYIVVGNARRVLVNDPFVITPDLTSKYTISPRVSIEGDGTGAIALSTVDPTTRKISGIEVISRGSDYTYANVRVFGNTGTTSVTLNEAVVRAVIPPRGGHGFDAESELNAQQIGFSATFEGTENGKIPGTGTEYRRVGIIVNPQYSNVLVKFTNTNSTQATFVVGTYVAGSLSLANGIVTAFYSSNSTIRLSNVSGVYETGDVLTSRYSNGLSSVNVTSNSVASVISGAPLVFDNRMQLICPSSTITGGSFNIGDKIVQVDGTLDVGTGYIQDIQTDTSNTYIYITEKNGYFQPSDIPTNTYKYILDYDTRQVRIQVDDIVNPDIVPYTGDILYVRNMQPVTRNSLQSETVKLIYGFS